MPLQWALLGRSRSVVCTQRDPTYRGKDAVSTVQAWCERGVERDTERGECLLGAIRMR